MKKAILTFGLFAMVVLTSFTTENMTGDQGGTTTTTTSTDGGTGTIGAGNTTVGGNKRLDYSGTTANNENTVNSTLKYSNDLSFNMDAKKKSDI